jgi:hypothetical protein
MKVFQIAPTIALAVTCFCLCQCASKNSAGAPKIALGFLPPDLSVTSRTIIPALSEPQAREKKMSPLDIAWRVKPETEVIHLGPNAALSVIQVPARAQVLQSDYPGFARGLSNMKDFINSKPAAYPDPPQPDFLFANASIYIRAKFRCLDLPWGKAVMMLAQYTQEAHPPPPNSEDLRIWIRGISNDALRGQGGFCLSGELTLKHPLLRSRDAACLEIEGQNETQAMAKAENQLESHADDSFTPSLRDIERMLRELKVEADRS